MKKVLIILFSLIGVVILAGILVPILFKDQIKEQIDKELAKSVNATVIFDADNFKLSVFKHFPNITVGLHEFGIVNKEPFEGTILFAVEKLDVVVNIQEILFGDKIVVEGIYIDEPEINIQVNNLGEVNYDIYIAPEDSDGPVEEEVAEETSSEEMSFGIKQWKISDAHFIYNDVPGGIYTEIQGLDHEGSGDFTLTVFDLETNTHIESITVQMDGASYLQNRTIDLDAVLNMDLDAFKFTFKENRLAVNDFAIGFDGWFAIPEEGFDMDLTFNAVDNNFKSLISLIPAIFLEGYEDLEASGDLDFHGYVIGKYTEQSMPSFQLNLTVQNGEFHYPDLPESVRNVQIAMLLDNKDGDVYNSLLDISKFHIDFGNNPINGKLRVENFKTFPIDLDLKANLNLAELSQMFPMEGTSMSGLLNAKILANGVYDSVKSIIPKVDALFELQDGAVSSPDIPFPLEQLSMTSTVKNESGHLRDTKISVAPFRMILHGEQIIANLDIEDMEDYKWDLSLAGAVNLSELFPVINELYPMPGTTLKGSIGADIKTSGKLSDLEAERYERLPTSGNMSITGFEYAEQESLPQGFLITNASMNFNPSRIELSNFIGQLGNSDLQLTGSLTNYLNYVLKDETIKGSLNYNGNLLDINEWMYTDSSESADEEGIETDSEESEMEVVEIPENIDFTINANISKILYDNLTLNNAKGNVVVKNGELDLRNFTFNTLGGSITMKGKYNAKDVNKPYFNYDLDINQVSIQQSYQSFMTVQKATPITKNLFGDYSTNFSIDGNLTKDMMPDLATITGDGLIKVVQASLKDSKIMTGINALTQKADASNDVSVSDIIMSAKIQNGRFSVDPFDLKMGNYLANVSGSNGLDGSLDYVVKMDVPAGQVGEQVNQAIAKLTGSNADPSQTIKLTIGVGGTYDDPKPKLLTANTGNQLKDAAKEELKEEVVKVIQENVSEEVADVIEAPIEETKEEVKKEVEETKDESKEIVKQQKDSVVSGILEGDTAKVENAIQDAQDKLKNLFNKKKKKKNN